MSSQHGTPKPAVDGVPTAPPKPPPSSSSSSQQQKEASACNACVQLVNSILRDPQSRPRQVLQALVGGRATLNSNNQPYPQGSGHDQEQEQPSFRLQAAEKGVQIVMRIPDNSVVTNQKGDAVFQAARTFLWNEVEPSREQQEEEQHRHQKQSYFFSAPSSPSSSPVMAVSPLTPQEVVAATTDLTKPAPSTSYKTETITVECRPCATTGPEQGARALIMGPTPLSIVACTNRLTPHDRAEMSQILVHELVHAYDVQRLQLNLGDCETAAYSEVRAAREAECYQAPTTPTGSGVSSKLPFVSPALWTELCVKQKAIGATQNLFPWKGRGCVGRVFRQAYEDPRPFSREDVQRWWNKNHNEPQ